MSFFSSGIAAQNNLCECYKKLQFFGVPLYKNEEDDEYAEGHGIITYESSFQLPGVLTVDTKITQYPIVNEDNLPIVFRQMAQVIPNLSDFELNVLSFWILDMFVEGLWTAQKAGMSHSHQRATLLWIAYLFNYVQKENPSRKDLFLHLKVVLFLPDFKRNEYSGEQTREELSSDSTFSSTEPRDGNHSTDVTWELPLPPGTMGISTDTDSDPAEQSTISDERDLSEANGEDEKSFHTATKSGGEETETEKNIRHMKIILEILYRIFARLWVYMEIQAVFHVMPSVEHVDLPFNLNKPKPKFKTDSFASYKSEKFGKRMSAVEELSEVMEMEKQLHKNDYILPLQAAEESKAYMKQVFAQPASDRSILSKGRDKKK